MNILLSSVGRRSYLVEYFKKTLEKEGGKVIGVNSEAFSSGMIACDKSFLVPLVTNKEYIPRLLDIAKQENVSMIVSLFDIDLPVLSQAKSLFAKEGIEIVVSSEKVIEIANDKWKTYNFLKENNIPTPLTYVRLTDALESLKDKSLEYPLFVKPRWGMGSIGIYRADNKEELLFFYQYIQKQIKESYLNSMSTDQNESVLIQKFIDGTEYGVDILNDLSAQYVMSVAKEKLAMRAGETDAAIVVDIPALTKLSSELSKVLQHIGNLDIDVLFDGKDYYVLELNARFGGGFPFSYLAGADFPTMLKDMVSGEKIKVPNIKIGVKALKTILPLLVETGDKLDG